MTQEEIWGIWADSSMQSENGVAWFFVLAVFEWQPTNFSSNFLRTGGIFGGIVNLRNS
jgi:hypothetical protein